MTYRRVGILYHPREQAAFALAESLCATILHDLDPWMAQTGDDATSAAHMAGTDLIVCVGGDGTVLWAARAAAPHTAHIVSINMGRLGFLSELDPDDAPAMIAGILSGDGMLDERALVECSVPGDGPDDGLVAIGLNDVVVGRAAPGRPVYLSVAVDGVHLARIRADAMIVATATGSTAYNLSAGGPVLMPQSRDLLLTPVAPHLSRMRPIVLPSDAVIEIQVETDHSAVVSVDGQVDRPLSSGCTLVCRRSVHVARFIRLGPPSDFFFKLADHLNLSTQRGEPAG